VDSPNVTTTNQLTAISSLFRRQRVLIRVCLSSSCCSRERQQQWRRTVSSSLCLLN